MSASTELPIIVCADRQLNKGESYVVYAEKNGWLNLGGDQWIKNNTEYIKFEKRSFVSSIAGKRVVSKVDNLRFYDSASWQELLILD